MGFEYSLVVLFLGSKYQSTTIKYSPCKLEYFASIHHVLSVYSGGLFVKYSCTYTLFSIVTLYSFYFIKQIATKTSALYKNLRDIGAALFFLCRIQ